MHTKCGSNATRCILKGLGYSVRMDACMCGYYHRVKRHFSSSANDKSLPIDAGKVPSTTTAKLSSASMNGSTTHANDELNPVDDASVKRRLRPADNTESVFQQREAQARIRTQLVWVTACDHCTVFVLDLATMLDKKRKYRSSRHVIGNIVGEPSSVLIGERCS